MRPQWRPRWFGLLYIICDRNLVLSEESHISVEASDHFGRLPTLDGYSSIALLLSSFVGNYIVG